MAKRDEIINYLRSYLNVDEFDDYCVNGLQVYGSEEVTRVVVGVSVSRRLILEAVGRGAQLIVVHHGFFKGDLADPLCLKGTIRDRLALLLAHDISLAGFHLPLDAHPEIGNNASACRKLGLTGLEKLDVGYVGNLPEPETLDEFVARVELLFGRKVQTFGFGKPEVRRVGIVTGGSSYLWWEAAAAGADVYICGDMKEHLVRHIEEAGLNVVNAGHYDTEKSGVINLAKVIEDVFGIPAAFIDIPNPV